MRALLLAKPVGGDHHAAHGSVARRSARAARAGACLPSAVLLAAALLAGACAKTEDVAVVKPADRTERPARTADPERPDGRDAEREAERTPRSADAGRMCGPSPERGMISFRRSVPPERMISVAAVGDVLLHDSLQKHAANHPDRFHALWAPIADLIAAADVAMANLEGPAAEGINRRGAKVRTEGRIYDGNVYTGYPMFNYHPSVIDDLKRAGFDVLQTANNHSLDRYGAGADLTVEAIAARGLASTGVKSSNDMDRPWYAITPVRKGDRRYNIAWLACTYGTNGIPDRNNQVLHCYENRETVLEQIRTLRARKDVHAVIAASHWGPEYVHTPRPQERELARDMAEAGATAIIGTHPHVMQPFEKLTTGDGREVFVAYSLGNFVSNQNGLPRRSSAIALLGLAEAEDGKLVPAEAAWIPIWMRRGGGVVQAEAIDRVGGVAGPAAANRRHLLEHLPAGNLHAPEAPFFRSFPCRETPVG